MLDYDDKVISLLTPEAAAAYRVVPIRRLGSTIQVGASRALEQQAVTELEFILGCGVETELWPEDAVTAALQEHYGCEAHREAAHKPQEMFSVVQQETDAPEQPVKTADESSIIEIVNEVITLAIRQKASDIHIEPLETMLRIRFRLDGALQTRKELATAMKNLLISRVKIMADLDIAEKRRPQDGRIRVSDGQRQIDLRVSTLPTDFGEKIVLRILDKSALKLDLETIGFSTAELQLVKKVISAPFGMILVTGPTGSGKTTTLYSALNHINSESVNVVTIEDPIEYNLEGISQAHMRADLGFTFAQALRAFLRQDPDVIMVGEIRDRETAEIAIRAALTGHLVLSTLHTNNASSAVTRLVEMGVEPFLVAASVKLVIAQRLVRRICAKCKQELEANDEMLSLIDKNDVPATSYHGVGCSRCYQTGYSGRTPVYEILAIDDTLAELIANKATATELNEHAIAAGMKTLRQNGLAKAIDGTTSVEEVLRETLG